MSKTKFPFFNKNFKEGKVKIKKGKKPYIKKLEEISKFTVWLVDGNYIRKNICEDFVNFDEHYHLKFIPKYEFWIEKETVPGEEKYYIDHLLLEWRLISKGMKYEKALKEAENLEKKERKKSRLMKELAKIKSNKKSIEKIHKKLIRKYKKLNIWLVNGELVRDKFCIDFFGGGHDIVYRFIPKKEIWIDDNISPHEQNFIILHELHERNLMAKGKKYREAHLSATEIEDLCRHHPSKLNKAIKLEILKNEK